MCFIYNNMSYSIRPAVAQDMPAVHALIVELAVFEREPDAVTLTLDQLIEDGFGSEAPRFHCWSEPDRSRAVEACGSPYQLRLGLPCHGWCQPTKRQSHLANSKLNVCQQNLYVWG